MLTKHETVSWACRTNIYEVNLRQYTPEGTINAFRSHLTRLYDMGVEVLWFMPLTPISVKNRKGTLGSYYACSSYTSINPEYGTREDFRLLVVEAHELGMKVIIDWVANHTGCDHEWTTSNPEFYKVNDQGEFYDAHGWDDVIDLDYSNHDMRTTMLSAMYKWIVDFDIDGFRCDMAMLTPDDFWHQARTQLDRCKPLFWFAELDPLEHPSYMTVFDTAYTWRWMHATQEFRSNDSHHIHLLREVLNVYHHAPFSDSCLAWFTSNHDENSWNGTEYEKYEEMAIPLAVFSATWKGIPLLYSGQELPNHKRLSFFEKDTIEWTTAPSLHEFYRSLFELRRKHEAFVCSADSDNCQPVHNSVDHHVLSFIRSFGEDQVLVIINFSVYALSAVQVDHKMIRGSLTEWFSSGTKNFDDHPQYFDLPAWGFQVWVK
jgi:alpha-amylase